MTTGAGSLDCMLFDADGVLQGMRPGWQADLTAMAGADPDSFLTDLFEAEIPAVRGEAPLRESLRPVLDAHQVRVSMETVLDAWRWLELDQEMLGAIAQLRRAGVVCALATNQHDVRAALMRNDLGYGDVFDAQFYSCELALYKPQPEYFATIVEQLDVSPERTLFVDDRENNVAGARSVGIHAEVFAELGGRPELDRILALHDIHLDR